MQKTGKLAVTAALVVAFAGAVGWSMTRHQDKERVAIQQEEVQNVSAMTGYVALDVEPFFGDERVKKILRDQKVPVAAVRMGSRDMAGKVATGAKADFYFPSGVLAGNQIADEAKKANVTVSQTTPFTSPMVVASWKPIAKILEANGMAKALGDRVYSLDMEKLAAVMLAKKRWRDLKGSDAYPVQRSVLVATTDVRKSNSAAMYMALISNALNGDVVTDRTAADATAEKVADLFKRQGFQEAFVNGSFDDYLQIGMGKAPMVFIYEYQMVMSAQAKKAIQPDMVLMYPSPTIVNKFVLTATTGRGKALAEVLSSNAELQKIAVEYGLRVQSPGLFMEGVKANGLAVQEQIQQVIDPPSFELMGEMVDVVTREMLK